MKNIKHIKIAYQLYKVKSLIIIITSETKLIISKTPRKELNQ